MTDTVDIPAAQAALGQMTRVVKAFNDAHVVVSVLANQQQVGRELDAQIAGKRATIAKMEGDAAEAQRANSERLIQAQADLAATLEVESKKKGDALAALDQQIAEKQSELYAVMSKLANARQKLDTLLAD